MYVSVWKRFWAFLIDVAVLGLIGWGLGQLFSEFTIALMLFVIVWLYYAIMESSPWQATLGKRIIGLKVVDKHGKRLSFWKASRRLLTRLITNITFYFGFFTAAFDKHRETLHDHLSKSVVISEKAEFNPADYQDKEDHILTTVIIFSAMLAILFVAGSVIWVVRPYYQTTQDKANAEYMIENLNAAAANRPARLENARLMGGEEAWLASYSGCVNSASNPKTLSCNGYTMTLEENGISAVSRLTNWGRYKLFKSYQTGQITCTAQDNKAEKFCQSLPLY